MRLYFKVRYQRLSPFKAFAYEPLWIVLFRWVVSCALLFAVYDVIWNRPPVFPIVSLPPWLVIIGMLMVLDALILLAWSHTALKERFSTTIGTDQVTNLVRSGPYHYIRHPMYLAYFWYFAGLFFVSGSILVTVLGQIIIGSLIRFRLPLEERELMKQFPLAYAHYRMQTKAFLPRVTRFRDT